MESIDSPYLISHRYHDLERFERLIKTIRFIIYYPFLCEKNGLIPHNKPLELILYKSSFIILLGT